MGEILSVLIVLALVLAFIAVLGHGIWMALAWLLRTLAGHGVESAAAGTRSCPQCGCFLQTGPAGCAACGWPLKLTPQARQGRLLRAIQRDVERYGRAELIDADCLARINTLLSEEQARLLPPAGVISAELVTAEAVSGSSAHTQRAEADGIRSMPATEPAERVQQYMARQEELARMPAETSVAAVPARRTPRPWSEIFKAFLEEKNIRWGELVGGLLIVCCSIALVISFWSAIAERPFLKFFVFNGVTAGLFGVGFYALHRLKLPHTSQGLLLIATLLAPLNFLAIAAFSRDAAPTDAFTIGGELISIGIFAALVYFAGKAITSPWPLALVLGVMGTSVAQLLVRRFIDPGVGMAWLYAMGGLPLVCYLGSVGWALGRRPKLPSQPDAELASIHALFRLLGLVTFALLLPWGLLLAKSGAPAETLRLLAPLGSLGSVPMLAVGLSLWRRATDPALAALRTAGTAIAVLGALIWLAGVPLAWPDPARMMAVSTIGFVVFTTIALRYTLPPAHLLAAGCFSLAAVLAVHVWRGQLQWQEHDPALVVRVLASASTGVALIPVCYLLAAAAALIRFGRESALYHAISATAASMVSLALILWFDWPSPAAMAGPLFALAGVWLAVSWLMQWPRLFTAFQALLSLAVVMAVTARLETEAWFESAALPWLDPWTLQAQAIALAVLGLFWVGVRIGAQRWSSAFRLKSLLNPPWPAFDRGLNVVLLIVLMALAVYGTLPGVAQELTPRKLAWQLNSQPPDMAVRSVPPLAAFELQGIPHDHALGYGTWLLAGVLIVVFFAAQWAHYSSWRVLGIVAIVAMACPLLAALWTPEVAAASALRWLAAGFLLVGSVAVWLPFAQTWPRHRQPLLLLLVAAPLVAVSLFVVTMALRGNPIAGPDPGSAFARMGMAASYAVPILLIAMSLVGHALRERSAAFAFTAGLLFNTAATAGYLLTLKGAQLDAALWVRLAQLNALVSAVYALAWLGALVVDKRRGLSMMPALLITQVMLPMALTALILVPSGVTLWWHPSPTMAHDAAGHWLGWLSFLATLVAGVWFVRQQRATDGEHGVGCSGCVGHTGEHDRRALGHGQLAGVSHLARRPHAGRRTAADLLCYPHAARFVDARCPRSRWKLLRAGCVHQRPHRVARSIPGSAWPVVVARRTCGHRACADGCRRLGAAAAIPLPRRGCPESGGKHLLDRAHVAVGAQGLRPWHGGVDRNQCFGVGLARHRVDSHRIEYHPACAGRQFAPPRTAGACGCRVSGDAHAGRHGGAGAVGRSGPGIALAPTLVGVGCAGSVPGGNGRMPLGCATATTHLRPLPLGPDRHRNDGRSIQPAACAMARLDRSDDRRGLRSGH